MLDIPPKFQKGSGIFDFAKKIVEKSANSDVGQKVLNSATTKNLKRAADSAIGQEIKKSVLSGVAKGSQNAAESAFTQLGIPRKKRKKKGKGIILD